MNQDELLVWDLGSEYRQDILGSITCFLLIEKSPLLEFYVCKQNVQNLCPNLLQDNGFQQVGKTFTMDSPISNLQNLSA